MLKVVLYRFKEFVESFGFELFQSDATTGLGQGYFRWRLRGLRIKFKWQFTCL